MICNICKNNEFVDFNGRKSIRCTKCNSLERTRLIWMFIEKLKIDHSFKILHMAPELGLYNKLREIVDPGNYIAADFNVKIYPFAKDCRYIDLTDLDH